MSNDTITIAGIDITINFCKKINSESSIKKSYISGQPTVSIYENEIEKGTFIVDIMAFLPTSLEPVPKDKLNDGDIPLPLMNDLDDLIYLSYEGVVELGTSINKGGDKLLCRGFNVEYYSTEKKKKKKKKEKEFDLYHIQFDYKLSSPNIQSVEAILVQLTNEDPVTDRGTVTGVRDTN